MKKKNTNCLEDFKCPECGSLGPFWIEATIQSEILMSDDGTVEEKNTATDWDEGSGCRCSDCQHEGWVLDFTEKQEGSKGSKATLEDTVAAVEREMIIHSLETTGGNSKKAAQILGTTERKFGYKAKKHGVNYRRYRSRR